MIFSIFLSSYLYCSLFIVSHDIHHLVSPTLFERILGNTCLICYGGFLMKDFSKKHALHHKYPGDFARDPDFFSSRNIILWYFNFMRNYLSIQQLFIQYVKFTILQNYLHVPFDKIIVYCAIPSILASFQLFYFGTYMVHFGESRIESAPATWPPWFVFLTSFNFGYHQEHHRHPTVPFFFLLKRGI